MTKIFIGALQPLKDFLFINLNEHKYRYIQTS